MSATEYFNDTNEFILSQDAIKNSLFNIKNFIKKTNYQSTSNEINTIYLFYKDNLIKSMEFLKKTLKKYDEFNDEYFIFKRINRTVKYTLNKEYSSIPSDDFGLIFNICDLFFNLIGYKLELLKKYDFTLSDEFNEEYNQKFKDFLDKYHELDYKFLTKIRKIEYENLDKLIEYSKFVFEEK